MKKKTTIFIIEDNEADIFLIKNIYKNLDKKCNFIEAQDGEKAHKLLEEIGEYPASQIPNVILLDLNLPKKNGFELLDVIKNHPVLKLIPVIIFSSSAAIGDIRTAYSKYANSYLIKPFDVLEFEKSISTMYNYWIKSSPVAV